MTVKYYTDDAGTKRIVLKDGKVSCSCCEECCMYPAQALADGGYSASDLPDAVTVDGTSFNRSGTSYGNTTNGVILEGNVWAKYRNGIRSERNCLIQSGVVDQFADTYTLTLAAGSPISVTVSRISLCAWRGNDGCGRPWYLIYSSDVIFGAGSEFKWNIWMAVDEADPCGDFQQRPQIKNSDEFDNTPIGNYTEGDYPAIVS
jgi:hypothetical protein